MGCSRKSAPGAGRRQEAVKGREVDTSAVGPSQANEAGKVARGRGGEGMSPSPMREGYGVCGVRPLEITFDF